MAKKSKRPKAKSKGAPMVLRPIPIPAPIVTKPVPLPRDKKSKSIKKNKRK